MIKIIKHGTYEKVNRHTNATRVITCTKCGCMFTFDDNDIDGEFDGKEGLWCPECNEVLYKHKGIVVPPDVPLDLLRGGIKQFYEV